MDRYHLRRSRVAYLRRGGYGYLLLVATIDGVNALMRGRRGNGGGDETGRDSHVN